MRVVLTGSSGRIGRAIFNALAGRHDVLGIDREPFATSHVIGDVCDQALLDRCLSGADAVIHTAALHAPHVGIVPDAEFERINRDGVARLVDAARRAGVGRIVYTSTTALYGHAIGPGGCTWVDERVTPLPRTIYHRTKLAAEAMLEAAALAGGLTAQVVRMSRCFPEPIPVMAAYRLHRGIDLRDVADAHVAALEVEGVAFGRHVVSGATPFRRADCAMLASDAPPVIRARAPLLAAAFDARGWTLPARIDRIYCPAAAERDLGWRARFGFEELIAQLDRRSLETIAADAVVSDRE